jgi:hypothetical protein
MFPNPLPAASSRIAGPGRAHRWASLAAAALLTASALAGCGEAREAFGLARTTPDEFAVVPRAPLTLPPDYSLRPPTPGAPRPQEETTRTVAQRTILGGAVDSGPEVSGSGEQALLDRAGADEALPDIRQVVERESADLLVADQSFVNRLLFWREPQPLGEVVDARAEARRLAENAATGDPVTEGETPTIERRTRAPLEGIFDGIF